MTASQEILNSIEDRLRQLQEEIAALRSAREELRKAETPRAVRPDGGRGRVRSVRGAGPAGPLGQENSEAEWLERRAAELAAQSRGAAAV